MAYEELNKLKWTGKLANARIIIRHRGAPNDEKLVLGKDIIEVHKAYFLCTDSKTGEETHIPMHRILKIESEDRLLWEKRGK